MNLGSDDLNALLDSFLLHLRGERKNAETVKSYRNGVRVSGLMRAGEHPARPSLTRRP